MKKVSLFSCCLAVLLSVIFFVFTTNEDDIEVTYAPIADIEIIAESVLTETINETENQANGEKTITPEAITNMVSQADLEAEGFKAFIDIKPSSLSDVPPPSSLGFDQNGLLIIDHRVKSLFEHHLSALGEEPLENVILRIKHSLDTQLSDANLDKAIQLLEGYLQYRNHLGILKNDYAQNHDGSLYTLEAVKEMKQTAHEARYSFFDEDAINGLFSKEDEYDSLMIARAEIASDPLLSKAEKAIEIQQLANSAPEWVKENTAQSDQFANMRKKTQMLYHEGVDDSGLYQFREERYGTEAANRLSALDERRQNWQTKVSAYRVELNSLQMVNSVNESDQTLLNEIRAKYFIGPEMLRIAAIDKMDLGF